MIDRQGPVSTKQKSGSFNHCFQNNQLVSSDAGRAAGGGGGEEESQVGIDSLMKELDAHTPRLASSPK